MAPPCIIPFLYAGREQQVKRIECLAAKAYNDVKREMQNVMLKAGR
jgi:hypothetical protein